MHSLLLLLIIRTVHHLIHKRCIISYSQDYEKAVYYAIMRGHVNVVKLLLPFDQPASSSACERGRYLLMSPSIDGKETVLMWATTAGNEDILKSLLDAIDEEHFPSLLNAKDNLGETVLHKAAKTGRLSIIRYLLEDERCRGILALDTVNKAGKTAYDIAKTKDIKVILDVAMKVRRFSYTQWICLVTLSLSLSLLV